MPIRRHLSCLAALLLCAMPAASHADELRVFAAASLKPALDEIDALPETRAIVTVIGVFAASSTLARQIEAGAQADVFIPADTDWMDHLAAAGLIDEASRLDLLGNELVLVAPAEAVPALRIAPGFALRAALGDGRLAIAEPHAVPAGRYARAALERLAVWSDVADRLVTTDNVRGALTLAARGEVPLAIVYRSDATGEPAVRVVDAFPASSHAPIVYPLAILRGRDSPAIRAYVRRLRSDTARGVFARHGFRPLAADAPR